MYHENHQFNSQFRNGKHDRRIGSACFERESFQFKGLLQHIQDDWNNLLTSEETQILTDYAEKSRKLTLAYSSMNFRQFDINRQFELTEKICILINLDKIKKKINLEITNK